NMLEERRYLGYATMDNGNSENNYIKDWNLIFSIPETVVFSNSKQIIIYCINIYCNYFLYNLYKKI
ncbi:hypothetical protein, partial [Clostridioides difficile]|uniref:hypothetical protein n=1 Tax=Clostridioides difficile TaxID=1496 RepID=UPI001F2618C9